MKICPVGRGAIVYDVADPRHHGIVRTASLRNGKWFANVQWLETGWHSYRIPVADLRRVAAETPSRTECGVMRRALKRSPK